LDLRDVMLHQLMTLFDLGFDLILKLCLHLCNLLSLFILELSAKLCYYFLVLIYTNRVVSDPADFFGLSSQLFVFFSELTDGVAVLKLTFA
jgi:hypothetical protein